MIVLSKEEFEKQMLDGYNRGMFDCIDSIIEAMESRNMLVIDIVTLKIQKKDLGDRLKK